MPAQVIKISGARQHNLKNLNLEIPREKLVVITGLSGSGKSSLAFDIPALSFRIKRIKRERGLPGPAQAGNNNQLLSRNLYLKILEIVLACTADLDSLRWHRTTKVEPVSQAQPSCFSSQKPRS